MKTNLNQNDLQDALARVEKAKSDRVNAQRRLSRAQANVETASKEVAETEEEMKAASTSLDQILRKTMSGAMKKGGIDLSIALAEIFAKSLGDTEDDQTEKGEKAPEVKPEGTPTPAPAASTTSSDNTPPASSTTSSDAEPDLLRSAN